MKKRKFCGIYSKKNTPTFFKGLHHTVQIHDYLAEVITSQSFINASDKNAELVYRYPAEISVNELKCTLYDPETKQTDVLTGMLKSKERAQEEYDDAIAEGSRAVVMEKSDDEEFYELSLGNIKAGMEITVKTKSVQKIEIENEEDEEDEEKEPEKKRTYLSLRLKSFFDNEEQEVKSKTKMKIDVKINQNVGEIEKIECTSHPLDVDVDPKNYTIITKNDGIDVTKDFIVRASLIGIKNSSAIISPIPEGFKDFKYAGIISMLPKLKVEDESKKKREFWIIVDCSGSMRRMNRIEYARQALLMFLQSMDVDKDITLNISKFGSNYKSLWKKPKRINEKTVREAQVFAKNLDSNMGGTNILSPLNHAMSKKEKNRSKQIFLFTDGEDSKSEEIIEKVKNKCKSTNMRVFTFGIGSGIKEKFCLDVAKVSKSTCTFIKKSENMQRKVLMILDKSMRDSLRDLDISFHNLQKKEYERIGENDEKPMVYNGQSHFEYFLLKKQPESCKIKFKFGEKDESGEEKATVRIVEGDNCGLVNLSMASEYLKFLEKTKKKK